MNFENKRILGMVHLSGENKVNRALKEIEIFEDEGVYGCIIENYHGSKYDVEDVLKSLEGNNKTIKIGINILPNEFKIAFDFARSYKVDFIQLDYIGGSYQLGNKVVKLNENNYIESKLNDVFVLGGVWPKYYTPMAKSVLKNDLMDAMLLGDAIVVTGSGTGKETPIDKIKLFRETMNSIETENIIGKNKPLIIGAGVDSTNVVEQLQYANGAIVGSCFKPYKITTEMIDKYLVREFMNKVKELN